MYMSMLYMTMCVYMCAWVWGAGRAGGADARETGGGRGARAERESWALGAAAWSLRVAIGVKRRASTASPCEYARCAFRVRV